MKAASVFLCAQGRVRKFFLLFFSQICYHSLRIYCFNALKRSGDKITDKIRLQTLNSWYLEGCAGGQNEGEGYDSKTFTEISGRSNLYPGYF